MCVLGLAPIWLPTLCVAYFGLTVKLRDVRPVRHQTARIDLSVSHISREFCYTKQTGDGR